MNCPYLHCSVAPNDMYDIVLRVSEYHVHILPRYLPSYVIHTRPLLSLTLCSLRGIKAAPRPSETSLNVGDGVDDGSTTNMSGLLMEGSDGNEASCPLSNGDDGDAPLNSPAPGPRSL